MCDCELTIMWWVFSLIKALHLHHSHFDFAFGLRKFKIFQGGEGANTPWPPLNEPLNTHMLNIMTQFVLKVGIVTTEYKNF